MVLNVENVGVYPEKGWKILSSLEQVSTSFLTELSDRNIEQLVNVQFSGGIDFLAEKLNELICDHRIDPNFFYFLERVRNLPLVLLEVDNLLVNDELLRVLGEKIRELLDMLPGYMTNLRRSLWSVSQQTLDGYFRPSSILPKIQE